MSKVTKDLNVVIKGLPEKVTPKTLDELFGLNDGGKTIRRHLRNKFADTMKHEKKADWDFKKDDPILKSIVEYFAERYEVATPKAEAKTGTDNKPVHA